MKKIILNKRGFMLGEETLKIVVAVICIIFLIYLLTAIYSSNRKAEKIEQAEESISRISSIVSSLKEGESESQDILEPKKWHLYSFTGSEKPNSCLNENCLCICDNSLSEFIKSQAKKCDEEGACFEISSLTTSNIDWEIGDNKDFLFIEIKNQNGGIEIIKLK